MSKKKIINKIQQEEISNAVSNIDDIETEEISLTDELIILETSRITDALVKANNNRSHAAKRLGIGRTLLIHKIKKYDLDKKELPIPY